MIRNMTFRLRDNRGYKIFLSLHISIRERGSYQYECERHINTRADIISIRIISIRKRASNHINTTALGHINMSLAHHQSKKWSVRNLCGFISIREGDISVMNPKGIRKSYQYDRSSIISKWVGHPSSRYERVFIISIGEGGGHINRTAATMCPWEIHNYSIWLWHINTRASTMNLKESIKNP